MPRDGDFLALGPRELIRVDVIAFEAAVANARKQEVTLAHEQAIALYGGELLPDDRFVEWTVERRSHLQACYVDLLGRVARLRSEEQDYERAIEALQQALVVEPADEGMHVDLMRQYALNGQRTKALAQYQRLNAILQRELETEPDAASEALWQAIRKREFPEAGSYPPGPTQTTPSGANHSMASAVSDGKRPARSRRQPLFVGRQRELALLREGLVSAVAGDGSTFLIAGEPGIGKTRTAEQIAEIARPQGVTVLWGRCYQGAGTPAYWPWIQVVRTLLVRRKPSPERAVRRTGTDDLSQLVPEMRDWWPNLSNMTLEGEVARFRLFDSLTAMVCNLGEEAPLLIILDDLQWADRSSLLLLEFLSREIEQARVLVLGLYRDTETDHQHPLASVLVEVARRANNRQISLRGLREHEVKAMVSTLIMEGAPENLTSTVAERTNGNPFFVREIVEYLKASNTSATHRCDPDWSREIPFGIRELIRQRLDRLSSQCRNTLATGSVIGREFDLQLLHAVTDVPAECLLDLLDEAMHAQLIRATSGTAVVYRFIHDLVRETVYDGLAASQRTELHERVGSAMERVNVSDLSPYYERVAHHFMLAAPFVGHDRAVNYLRKAGDRAMTQIAYDDAAEYYRSAVRFMDDYGDLDHGQRADLLLKIGEAQRRGGNIPAARAMFQQTAILARTHNLPERLAHAALGMSGGIVLLGRDDMPVLSLLDEAIQALGPEDSAMKAQLLARKVLAFPRYTQHEVESHRRLSAEAIALARRVEGPSALAIALHASHRDHWWSSRGQLQEGIDIGAEMVDAAEAAGDVELLFTGTCWRIFEPLALGDLATVDRLTVDCERLVSELRQPFYTYVATGFRAMRALLSGQIAFAEELTEQARFVGQQVGVSEEYGAFWWWVLTFQLHREQDRIVELDAIASNTLEQLTDSLLRRLVLRSQLAVIQGSKAAAFDDAQGHLLGPDVLREIGNVLAAIDAADQPGWFSHTQFAVAHLAEAASILGDVDHAPRLYELLRPYAAFSATISGAFMCVGSVSHYLGLLATALSRWEDAERHFRDALTMNEQMHARPFATRTRYAWADTLLRSGNPGDRERARALLAEVDQATAHMGMVALGRQAAQLRARHFNDNAKDPARPTAKQFGGVPSTGLTKREIDVLRLVAQGMSDWEIADDRFISHSTVQTHLTSILGKLGVNSRAEATARAIRRDLV